MARRGFALALLLIAVVVLAPGAAAQQAPPSLAAKVVATGLVQPAAIAPVGVFLPGGPFHDNEKFAAFTLPGQVLDPTRLLVASGSNYGAPLAQADQRPGSLLSIDPVGDQPLAVPADFAAAGGQAGAAGGRVQLYTAQSPAFLNRAQNPDVPTAVQPAVASPRGLSINNAFGRPWSASAPFGLDGPGSEGVLDGGGMPRLNPAGGVAGGLFYGDLTNRRSQFIPGSLSGGAFGTALLGKSPDGSGGVVFAVVLGDGGVVQADVAAGVDGLAPAGTIRQLDDGRANRAGVVFNWTPNAVIYLADPLGNGVVALTLGDDGQLFRVQASRRIESERFSLPIDLAPAIPEIASPGFSSNTTLAGGSDLYVANRGNGTIVRMSQDGTVLAVRQVELPGQGALGPDRLNGLAVSKDAQKLWVTVTGPLPELGTADGAVLELPAFGSDGAPAPAAPR